MYFMKTLNFFENFENKLKILKFFEFKKKILKSYANFDFF